MTDEAEVLTPHSPRWEEFIEQLDAALAENGCDAKTLRHAIAVMRKMGGVDIEATVDFLESHGGGCNCEIFLNVCTGDEKYLNDAIEKSMTAEERLDYERWVADMKGRLQ